MNELFLVIRAQLLREGLRKLLSDASFSVIGEASTSADALQFIEVHRDRKIELIIAEASICYETPGFLTTVRQAASGARVVLLANQDDVQRLGYRSITAVDGILSLQISAEVMAQSLRVVQLGERMIPTDLIMSLMAPSTFNHTPSAVPSVEAPDTGPSSCEQSPSRREIEILKYLVDGCSNKAIARELGITEATVKVHLKGLLRKIRASNRTQAAVWALNNGINVLHFSTERTAPEDRAATL